MYQETTSKCDLIYLNGYFGPVPTPWFTSMRHEKWTIIAGYTCILSIRQYVLNVDNVIVIAVTKTYLHCFITTLLCLLHINAWSSLCLSRQCLRTSSTTSVDCSMAQGVNCRWAYNRPGHQQRCYIFKLNVIVTSATMHFFIICWSLSPKSYFLLPYLAPISFQSQITCLLMIFV